MFLRFLYPKTIWVRTGASCPGKPCAPAQAPGVVAFKRRSQHYGSLGKTMSLFDTSMDGSIDESGGGGGESATSLNNDDDDVAASSNADDSSPSSGGNDESKLLRALLEDARAWEEVTYEDVEDSPISYINARPVVAA